MNKQKVKIMTDSLADNLSSDELLQVCYEKSIELLKKNSTKYGVLASSPSAQASKRNYLSIFARDASICSLGMVASADKGLIKTARLSLETLGRYQTAHGQIPNYVQPEHKKINFWIQGSIDATLWWLIAVYFYNKQSKGRVYKPKTKIKKAIEWLYCQEHPINHLLVQQEASDWADIMPREGTVLYGNALWLAVKKFYKLKDYKKSLASFDYTFYPYNKVVDKDKTPNSLTHTLKLIKKHQKTSYYLSYVNCLHWGHDFNIYGNLLPIIFEVCPETMTKKIIKTINKQQKKSELPVPTLYNPIKEDSKEWQAYMKIHNQNFPDQYHNGGRWPFIGAFYAIALQKVNKNKQAREELLKTARANAMNNWEFNEWLHGKTGEILGMRNQSWNAGVFLLASQYLNKKINL